MPAWKAARAEGVLSMEMPLSCGMRKKSDAKTTYLSLYAVPVKRMAEEGVGDTHSRWILLAGLPREYRGKRQSEGGEVGIVVVRRRAGMEQTVRRRPSLHL